VEVDLLAAVLWCRQAADAGIADAQFNMGAAYEIGQGVSVDPDQAIFWYRAAIAQGYTRASYNLGGPNLVKS
jgi:TPR repeat protein